MPDPKPDEKKRLCPDCAEEIPADARRCPACDFPLVIHADLERVRKVIEKTKPKSKEECGQALSWLFGE